MVHPVSRLVIDLIKDGTIPVEDYEAIRAATLAATPAPPIHVPGGNPPIPTVGKKYVLRGVSPQYLNGMIGTLGKEPRQQTRLALYIDPAEAAAGGDRVKKFLKKGFGGRLYIGVKQNMIQEI